MFRRFFRRPTAKMPARRPFRPRLEALEDRCVPAGVTWTLGDNGDFAVAGNWTVDGTNPPVHRVPTASDDVSIPGNVVVTSSASQTVNSISATGLRVLGGTFTVNNVNRDSGLVALVVGTGATFRSAGRTTNVVGSEIAGTINVPAGATVRFLREANNLNPGAQLSGAGQFLIEGDVFGGPHVVLNTDVTVPANVRFSNGVIEGSGKLTIPTGVTFSMTSTNGTSLRGSGVTEIQSGATLLLAGAASKQLFDRTINNAGTILFRDNGTLEIGGNSVLNNLASGVFRIENDVDFGNSATAVINNAGTFIKTSPVGTGDTQINVPLNNTGTVRIDSGSMALRLGGTHTGTFNLAAGNLAFSTNTTTLNAGTTFTGPGTVVLTGGNLVVNGNVSMLHLDMSGDLSGSGTLTLTGSSQWTEGVMGGPGTTVVAAGVTLDLPGGNRRDLGTSRKFNNFGTVTFTGTSTASLVVNSGVVLTNKAGGVIDFQTDMDLTTFGGASIVNEGLLKKSGGITTSQVGDTFLNTGTVRVETGTLAFGRDPVQTAGTTFIAAGATLSASSTTYQGVDFDLKGGTLTGSGTVAANRFINSGGTVNPGSPLGALSFTGTYEQGTNGTLAIELGGTAAGSFDRLAVAGAATLAGTLSVSLANGFTPAVGNGFSILNYASRSGDFTTKNGLNLTPTRRFTTTAGATSYTLNTLAVNAGTLQLSSAAASVAEGAAATITVTRSGGSEGPVSVSYSTSSGTATSGSDYVPTSGTLSWADGDATAKTFLVYALTDSATENEESLTVALSNPNGTTLGTPATATLTITDVPPAPTGVPIQFSAATFTANRSAGSATVTITRSSSTGTASVAYATTDGSAAAGEDYTATSGTLTFGTGETSKNIVIPLVNDGLVGDETFLVGLSNPGAGAILGSPASAVVTVVDNVSSANARFVHQAYRDVLKRPADVGGLLYWARALEQGVITRDQVVQAFVTSVEYRSLLVAEQYRTFLRRETDAGGLRFWVNFLGIGGVIEDLKALILGSEEYFRNAGGTNDGYLTQLYRDLFSRDIDAGGRTYWLGLLNGGSLSRAQLAQVFVTVKETLDTLNAGFIRTYLRRDPRPGEVDPYTRGIQNRTMRDEDVVRLLVASDEYFQRV